MGRYPVHCILYGQDISQVGIEGLVHRLQRADTPPAVLVNSPGGTFHYFSTLGPVIQRRGITTIGRDVRSAAVLLMLLGHHRMALPNATFFFHEVRAFPEAGGGITVRDFNHVLEHEEFVRSERREYLEEWHRTMRMAQAWFMDFLAQRTGFPPSTFLRLMEAEATLTAHEACRYGLVHEVLSERAAQSLLIHR